MLKPLPQALSNALIGQQCNAHTVLHKLSSMFCERKKETKKENIKVAIAGKQATDEYR